MKKYLVIWRTDEDDFYQSCVELGEVVDARQMTNADWARAAAEIEGYSSDAIEALAMDGYELILVSDFPENFYGS